MNVFKTLDFDSLDTQRVKFLPPTFNGDVLFELPLVDTSGPFHICMEWTSVMMVMLGPRPSCLILRVI
jgi:hypothetical protein